MIAHAEAHREADRRSARERAQACTQASTRERASDALVERLRAGDPSAFDAMYQEFVAALRGWAYRHTRSREAAVEIVHDVFLAVWRGRAALAPREGLGAYLYGATRNRALDWLARESVRRRWRARAVDDGYAGPDGRRADAEEAERPEVLQAILAAIEAMPERRRVVCSLRWRQGMSLADIATQLAISQKTVETQLSRGLKQLRDQFQPE